MAERYIPDHRKTQFKAKNTFKPEELRRRREEQQVEIRKAKREENLAKRRGISGRDGTQTAAPGASLGASLDSDDEGGTIESQVCYEQLPIRGIEQFQYGIGIRSHFARASRRVSCLVVYLGRTVPKALCVLENLIC